MKVEVNSAADFLMNLLRVRQQVNSLSETQLHSFRGSLIIVLLEKYNNHWYNENPRKGTLNFAHTLAPPLKMTSHDVRCLFSYVYGENTKKRKHSKSPFWNFSPPFTLLKGSAFRCIRINGETPEPLIERAAANCGISATIIRQLLPAELTLWIDPYIVSYRIGENGSISALYDGNRSSPSDLESSGSENCCEISPELNKLVLDFYEKSNNSIITTKPKRYTTKSRQNINSPPRYFHSFYHHSPSNNQYYQNKAF